MKCPYCGGDETKVLDKRGAEENKTRRRRECLSCGKRFTTYERIEVDLRVVKKDGRIEQYSREKLMGGVLKACEKRPVTKEEINAVVDRIEAMLREMNSSDVNSRVVGDLVMKELKMLDKVAYIRFASVYREFADVEDFEKEVLMIKNIEKRR